MFISRLIIFIICFAGGIYIIKFREKIARTFGQNEWAERFLGGGGTYTMWILIGMIVMILGLLTIMGKMAFVGL